MTFLDSAELGMPPRLPLGEFGGADESLQLILEFPVGANVAAENGAGDAEERVQ